MSIIWCFYIFLVWCYNEEVISNIHPQLAKNLLNHPTSLSHSCALIPRLIWKDNVKIFIQNYLVCWKIMYINISVSCSHVTSSGFLLVGGGTKGIPPITEKLACPHTHPPTPFPFLLPQKCWFCNFHAVFNRFAQNRETLRILVQ